MIKNKFIKNTALALAIFTGLNGTMTVSAGTSFKGEYRQGEILSFGSSLKASEEAALREYFGVSSDMEAIYVDNKITIEQLGLAPDALDNYDGGWYSSAYVKLTDKGGINVSSNNVSLVTNEMFTNALLTSGILNCEVIVSAPFMVTGESALAGILAGAEEIMGEGLSEQNKVVAKEEIDTTLEIADEILNNEENEINTTTDSSTVASGIINDIKQQVIKDSPNSTQIQQIIVNVTNNYGVELSSEANERVLRLMEDVNDLDIEYKDIKETMKNIGDSISESLKEAGVKIKESGILEKIGDWFVDLFKGIGEWFKSLFAGVGNQTESSILEDDVSSEVAGELPVVSEEIPDLIGEEVESLESPSFEGTEAGNGSDEVTLEEGQLPVEETEVMNEEEVAVESDQLENNESNMGYENHEEVEDTQE